MVLHEILARLKNLLGLEIFVGHVHHGPGNTRFRSAAGKCVEMRSRELGLPFLSVKGTKRLSSESELREFRWLHLRQWKLETGANAIVTAHHYRDLLETRLLRLIRGTGPDGFAGMNLWRGGIWRPFLFEEKSALLRYAKSRQIDFVEDPTNRKTDAFRNWMRKWLDQLDRRQPNGTRNIARSLNELAQQLEQRPPTEVLTNGGIDRRLYLQVGSAHRRVLLAGYCRQLGLRNYTQGHIEELVKRLDDRQKRFTFGMLRCVWNVTPDQIKASRGTRTLF